MNIFVQQAIFVVVAALIAPTLAQQNPKCYLCGDGGLSNVTKPNTTIPLPEFSGFGRNVTCGQIELAGELLGLIPPSFCALLNSSAIRLACGCQSSSISAPVPPGKPVPTPSKGDAPKVRGKTTAPSKTPSNSPTESPVVKGAKRNKNGKNLDVNNDAVGTKLLSDSERAALAQLLTEILRIVNLFLDAASDEDSVSDVPSITPSIVPSTTPSDVPSTMPSRVPSTFPSGIPSAVPSTTPSDVPSTLPSSTPFSSPSEIPSQLPSSAPSDVPIDFLSDSPSALPTVPQSLESVGNQNDDVDTSLWEQIVSWIKALLLFDL